MKKAIKEGVIVFTFDGELESVAFNPAQASDACRTHAMLHGFNQRIGDAAAISKTEENGFVVTEAMRRAAVVEMVDHYASGAEDWNLKASARKPVENAIIRAIATKLGITYEEAQAKVAAQFLAEMKTSTV